MEDTAAASRLARIRQLLDQASAGVQASYQGLGAFWQLPLPQLLGAELYGVRLIAPAPDDAAGGPASAQPPAGPPAASSGCCHAPAPPPSCCTPASAPAATPPQRGRGAASGLVKGLKGEAPFDGNPFPRLPWGGRALAAQDIALVEQWIDDGCPEQDTPADPAAPAGTTPADGTPDPRSATRAARAGGHEPHPPSAVPGNLRPALQGGRKLRKNIDALTPEELRRLRAALRQMHRFDAFELDERGYTYWARIHGNNCQHGWEQFLPWHRMYLHFFEQALQDIDPSVTVPYWDWSAYHAQDQQATTPDSGIIPAAFRCYVDDSVLAALDGKIPAASLQGLRSTMGQDFNSGLRLFTAAGITYGADPAADDRVFAALTDANPLFHRFRWPGGNNALLFEDYPAPQDVDNILALDSFHDFGSGPEQNHFYGAVENLHNLIHNFCGGINPNYQPSQPQQNRYEPQYGDMVAPGITAFPAPVRTTPAPGCRPGLRQWATASRLQPSAANTRIRSSCFPPNRTWTSPACAPPRCRRPWPSARHPRTLRLTPRGRCAPKCGCMACSTGCAAACCVSSSTSLMPMRRRPSAATRITPASSTCLPAIA